MKGIYNQTCTTCYFNSGLQMLYHIKECHAYISNYTGGNPDLIHIKEAFSLLDSSGGDPVILTKDTINSLKVGDGHQDVDEFLTTKFFSHIGPTDISSLYFVDTEKACCIDNSGKYIDLSFNEIPQSILILPMKDISGQSLAGLTEEYQKEVLVSLDRCRGKSAVKQHTITIPDQNRYLIVKLNRYVSSVSGSKFTQNKLDNPVIAEDLLTVGGVEFTLRGIIHHSGGVTGGHYVYHLKTENKWTVFDDSNVTSGVTIDDNTKNSGYVYLYERVMAPTQAHTQAPAGPGQPPTFPGQAPTQAPTGLAQAPAAVPANLTNFLTRQSISVNANWSILEPVQTIPDEIKPYIGETKSFVRAPAEFKGEYEFLKVHGLAFLYDNNMYIHTAAEELYGVNGAFATKSAAKYLSLMYKYTLPGRKLALESAKGLAKNTEAGDSVETQLGQIQGYLKRIKVVMGQAFTQAPTQAPTGALLPAPVHTPAPTPTPHTLAPSGPTQAPTPHAPVHTPAPAPTPHAPAPTPPTQAPTKAQITCALCKLSIHHDATECAHCGASFVKPPAVIVMRHGVRADFPRSSSRSSSLSLCEQKDISNAWFMLGTILGTTNTETERPYDTPLCEYTRPKEAYNDISDRFSQITRIVTSPFVRCVQTAAAIAAQMPTEPEIFVNRNLGEKYSTLRTYTENNPIKRLTFQELTSDELERVFKQAYKDAGSKEFKGKVMLREDPKWNEFNDDRAWFNMLDTEIKKEIRQKGDGTLLLITHGDVARIINNHDKDFDNTGIRLWLLDYCGYYTNISEPTKPDEFSTEWKAGKFIISAAVGQSINK